MRKKIMVGIAMSMVSISTFAGGFLTNTNQNVRFLRNPARDGAIGIDGVYSNPAGVAFLNDGFHLSLNIQNVHQTRTIHTGFPLFNFNANNPGQTEHRFKGVADAPVLPSIQLAYNKDNWSYQFGFAIVGGGGKCEFEDGLGSFESIVSGMIASKAKVVNEELYAPLGALGIPGMVDHKMGNGYAYDSYMRGRQYYYGFTFGAARKLNDNLSLYGGLRMLYGSANYYGYVRDIKVQHITGVNSEMVLAKEHFGELAKQLYGIAGQLEANGETAKAAALKGAADQVAINALSTEDIELNCDQTGWGVAPIIGIDYKTGKFNFGAKYEFKTRMRLKNKSANSESYKGLAASNELLGKYIDGKKVAEDSPALLTVGAQYSPIKSLRLNLGYHHYFDVDTKQYKGSVVGDTNEYLFGAEYDINKIFQISAGGQLTRYDMTDDFMNDISFNVNSYSFGFGLGINLKENIKLNLAYFQTNYEDYDKKQQVSGMELTNSFTRTNRVLGIGVDFTF